jgi:hypothetical protein
MMSLGKVARFAVAAAALAGVALAPAVAAAAQVFVEGRSDGDYPRAGVPIVVASMEIVMASFDTPRSELNAVANLTDQSVVKVEVVDTRPLANAEAIAWAESENAAGVEKLRTAIEKNEPFKAQLEGEGVAVGSVMAAGFGIDGALILYAANPVPF